MNNIPPSSPLPVPSIHIQGADDASALFDGGGMFSPDMFSFYNLGAEDTGLYPCSQGLQSEYPPIPSSPSELEDIPELSHLTTTRPYLTDHGYSLPYSILQENGVSTDGGLSPSSLGSPIPSPTSSFSSSLSPSSFYDPLALSDNESPVSPSPTTPDQQFWSTQGLNHLSSDSLASHHFIGSFPNDPILLPASQFGPHRSRSNSSPSRREPVASKAMLEANSRRRRHPAQFQCQECTQTFTALFSLKRHSQSHTGERPYACGIRGCTQRFYNSSDCKRHEKSKKRHKDLAVQ